MELIRRYCAVTTFENDRIKKKCESCCSALVNHSSAGFEEQDYIDAVFVTEDEEVLSSSCFPMALIPEGVYGRESSLEPKGLVVDLYV